MGYTADHLPEIRLKMRSLLIASRNLQLVKTGIAVERPGLNWLLRASLPFALGCALIAASSARAGVCSDVAFAVPPTSSINSDHIRRALGELRRAIPQLTDPKEPLAASWLASSLLHNRDPKTRIPGYAPTDPQIQFHRSRLPEARIRSMHRGLTQVEGYRHLQTPEGSIETVLNATAYLAATLGDNTIAEPLFYDGLAMAAMMTSDLTPSVAQKFGSTKSQINDDFARVLRETLLKFHFRGFDRLPKLYDFMVQDPHLLVGLGLFSASKANILENGQTRPAFFLRSEFTRLNIYALASEELSRQLMFPGFDLLQFSAAMVDRFYSSTSVRFSSQTLAQMTFKNLFGPEPAGRPEVRAERWRQALHPLIGMLAGTVNAHIDLYKSVVPVEDALRASFQNRFVWRDHPVYSELLALTVQVFRSYLSPHHPKLDGRPVQALLESRQRSIETWLKKESERERLALERPAHLEAGSRPVHTFAPARSERQFHVPRSLTSGSSEKTGHIDVKTQPVSSAALDVELISAEQLVKSNLVAQPKTEYLFAWTPPHREGQVRRDRIIFSNRFLAQTSNPAQSGYDWRGWLEAFLHGMNDRSKESVVEVKQIGERRLWRIRIDPRKSRVFVGREVLADGTVAWIFLEAVPKPAFDKAVKRLETHQHSWIELLDAH